MGAEAAAMAAAGSYVIEGGFPRPYFRRTIVNTGEGLVNAGLGVMSGVFSVERWHNLYLELGASAQARCAIEHQSPSYDQPFN